MQTWYLCLFHTQVLYCMYISTCHTKMCCTNFEYSKVSLEAVNKPFDWFSLDYKVHFQFKYRFKNVKMQYDSVYTELSKSLSCLSDNRSGRCGQCVRPIKHLLDLHFFYNFNWITHILAKSIKIRNRIAFWHFWIYIWIGNVLCNQTYDVLSLLWRHVLLLMFKQKR
jgi:hypothetical protein